VSGDSDWRVPSPWARGLGILAAAFIAGYGAVGVLRNDLIVSLAKSSAGVHLHGSLAWLCFAGILMMAVGMVRFLGPPFDDGNFDFDKRRGRFGPIFAIGLGLMVFSHSMAST